MGGSWRGWIRSNRPRPCSSWSSAGRSSSTSPSASPSWRPRGTRAVELTRWVRALELRRDRDRAFLIRADPRWRDPEFHESVRASELRMFRDALTIAQVHQATEALVALVAEAAESLSTRGRDADDARRVTDDRRPRLSARATRPR